LSKKVAQFLNPRQFITALPSIIFLEDAGV